MDVAVSNQAAIDLRALIDAALANPQSPEPRGGGRSPGPGGNERKDFCSMWPEARPVLTAIAASASGAGAFLPQLVGAGPVLMALIATVEAVYAKTCGTK